MQVDTLLLDVFPESFDEHVVDPASFTSNFSDSSASVLSPLRAANATFALYAAV